MKKGFERRNLSFPPGLIKEVQAALKTTETISGIVTDYLTRFVAARKSPRSKK